MPRPSNQTLLNDRANSFTERPREKVLLWRSLKQGADYALSSSAGIEIVVLYALLLAVEYLAPGHQPFEAISPHPYWVPVLLLSVRHGTAAGLTAALVGIAFYWVHGVPTRIPEEDYYAYSLRIWHEPMLWLVVALIVGEIRLGHIEDRNNLVAMLRTAQQHRATIVNHWTQLAGHVETLERDIAAASETSVETALSSLADIRSADNEGLPNAFRRAAGHLLGDDARVAFWRSKKPRGAAFTLDDDLSLEPDVSRVSSPRVHIGDAGPHRILSIACNADRPALNGAGLLAGAVPCSRTRGLHGVLVVQHLDRERLSTGKVALSILCQELATALDGQDIRGVRPALPDTKPRLDS